MIVFDLLCSSGHRFESWFQSGIAFERQQAEGAIECPLCRTHTVVKAPMAPHVARSAESAEPQSAEPQPAPEAGREDEMANALRRLRQHIEASCDYVGATFPEEARRIFYGETERRDIYGEASLDDAAALRDEGIEVQPLPWMFRRQS
jgi:hypothetical protein